MTLVKAVRDADCEICRVDRRPSFLDQGTEARQEWSALKTCPRKTHSVTSGEKMQSNQPARRAVSAWARTVSVRIPVNGKSPL
jgi:hypothetical protein